MTPEALVPPHPKKDRVTPRDAKFTPVQPVGYIITLNKHVVPEAGNGGVIKNRQVAERLRDAFIEARPELTVELFGVFPVAK
jgi:hypothetical protein